MKTIFKKNQEANRKSLYPQPTVKVRVRDVQIIMWTVIIYTCIIGSLGILFNL